MRIRPDQLRAMHELISCPLQFTQRETFEEWRARTNRERARPCKDPERFADVIALVRRKTYEHLAEQRSLAQQITTRVARIT